MKKQTRLRLFLAALVVAGVYTGLCSCGKPDEKQQETEIAGTSDSVSLDKEESAQKEEGGVSKPQEQLSCEAEQGEERVSLSDHALEAMTSLQQLLTGSTRLGVLYLGERGQNESEPLVEWLRNNNPGMLEQMPFLAEIPQECIIGSYGDLYCVLPRRDDTTLVVREIEWVTYGNGGGRFEGEELYRGKRAEPVLVYVTHGEWGGESDATLQGGELGRVACWEPSVELGAEAPDGESLFWWSPKLDLESVSLAYLPCDEKDVPMMLDLSHYGDVGFLWGPDAALASPTIEGATGKWLSENGWMLHLAYDPAAENGSGGVVLYHPCVMEDGTTGIEFDCHGTWTLQDASLQLEAYDAAGNMVGGRFRVCVSPSGELYIYEAEDGTKLPFFEPDDTYAVLCACEE